MKYIKDTVRTLGKAGTWKIRTVVDGSTLTPSVEKLTNAKLVTFAREALENLMLDMLGSARADQ